MTLKRMVPPERIRAEAGKAIFMKESGEYSWAFDANAKDDVYECGEQWIKCAEGLSEFLVHNALHEAAHNAKYSRWSAAVEEDLLSALVAPMTEVAFGGWLWPQGGRRIFMSENLVADIGPAVEDRYPWGVRTGYLEVQVGSKDAQSLAYLDGLLED